MGELTPTVMLKENHDLQCFKYSLCEEELTGFTTLIIMEKKWRGKVKYQRRLRL